MKQKREMSYKPTKDLKFREYENAVYKCLCEKKFLSDADIDQIFDDYGQDQFGNPWSNATRATRKSEIKSFILDVFGDSVSQKYEEHDELHPVDGRRSVVFLYKPHRAKEGQELDPRKLWLRKMTKTDEATFQSVLRLFSTFLDGNTVYNDHIKKNKISIQPFINSESITSNVTNINLVAEFMGYVVNQTVVSFYYSPYDGKTTSKMIFHPHYIKEYNSRWYVMGIVTNDPMKIGDRNYKIALDRVEDKTIVIEDELKFISGEISYYERKYGNVIGVTDEWKAQEFGIDGKRTMDITLHTHTAYMHKMMTSKWWFEEEHYDKPGIKPFKWIDEDNKEYECGEITMYNVKPNMELTNKILAYGPELEVVGPKEYRAYISDRIKKMSDRY